ncbi:MAG: phosphoenolpyruvate--protein phosphotransferase, partial [Clostridia bacterium]|nr:phosphoenolpyruvate--protein phosphotransferase [Clostridia bacterium]
MSEAKPQTRVLHGVGICGGRVAGPLSFFRRPSQTALRRERPRMERAQEWERLQRALRDTAAQIASLKERALRDAGEAEAQIFEIHGMLLEDEDLLDALQEELTDQRCAEEALEQATKRIATMLENLGDPYLSARAADLRDVSGQVARALAGESQAAEAPQAREPHLLVADDLTPSETVLLDKSLILGFITFRGTPNSHTAILARAMGIPALIGVGEIDPSYDGTHALLDSAAGTLTLCPTAEQATVFAEKQRQDHRIAQDHDRYLRALLNKPAVTCSGHKIMIYANIGDGNELDAALSNGAEGIGLLRSEFLYLGAKDYPREEDLYSAYADIAVRMQGKRAIIRTLDIGADKRIPYFGLPDEENPALGFRAIRICLAREDLFKTQLRAILRASALGRLAIMLPMIVSVDEVRHSRRLLEECMQELREQKKAFDAEIELGIMIETPAAAVMSPELAQEVSFFSVGTNDLIQ